MSLDSTKAGRRHAAGGYEDHGEFVALVGLGHNLEAVVARIGGGSLGFVAELRDLVRGDEELAIAGEGGVGRGIPGVHHADLDDGCIGAGEVVLEGGGLEERLRPFAFEVDGVRDDQPRVGFYAADGDEVLDAVLGLLLDPGVDAHAGGLGSLRKLSCSKPAAVPGRRPSCGRV